MFALRVFDHSKHQNPVLMLKHVTVSKENVRKSRHGLSLASGLAVTEREMMSRQHVPSPADESQTRRVTLCCWVPPKDILPAMSPIYSHVVVQF